MPTGKPGEIVRVGDWLVNPVLDTLHRGSETHKIEPQTMRLLVCLADSVGAVVSVDRLLTEVWTGVVVSPASVYQAVSQLRKLLGDVDPNPAYIATVPRKGYRLVAPVHRVAAEAKSITADIVVPPAPAPAARGHRWVPMLISGVALLALIRVGSSIWQQLPAYQRVAESNASIVVLPFIDLTAEKADQSFCDGLTEELSNRLSQIPTLRVVARTSAFAFRGQGEDVRRIGKVLDTTHILEGSVRRSGNHVRVTVQLVDARDGYHLWSADYDTAVDDAIQVQEDISQSVAENLQARFAIADRHWSGFIFRAPEWPARQKGQDTRKETHAIALPQNGKNPDASSLLY
ncbi:MAG: winged helix-turn-helix domain-containing protein [Steroidobacteraceae bacterium]